MIALSLAFKAYVRYWSIESRSLGVERKQGGNLHPWLNTDKRSIANKYPEGKLKSTSKGELKDLKSLRGKRVAVTQAVLWFCWKARLCPLWVTPLCSNLAQQVSTFRNLTSLLISLNFIEIVGDEYLLAVWCQKWHVYTTRLETRTKELNMCASVRVVNSYAQWKRQLWIPMQQRPTIRFALEHICLDPKDGDLYLSWVKPGETLVEARSDTDVQIVRQTWA